MVDIQSPTAEIRRGKKKKKEERGKYIWSALLHRATINYWHRLVSQSWIKQRPASETGITELEAVHAMMYIQQRYTSVQQPASTIQFQQ